MAKRKKIALRFSYNEGWIAGAYYIMNLVHALKTLPVAEQPSLIICATKKDFTILKNETQYTYLRLFDVDCMGSLSFCKRIINGVHKLLFNTYLFDPRLNHFDAHFVYPAYGFPDQLTNLLKKVYWIPDFQEQYYPQYFSDKDLLFRDQANKSMLYGNNAVVFSSQAAKSDSSRFFPNNNAQSFVLPFAVTLPDISAVSFSMVKAKYQLPERYFFCPNQFWQHKNHITVLKAVVALKAKGIDIHVMFSGKEEDNRNKDYVQSLKQFCADNDLTDRVRFLGFLDRKEQLCILKNSVLVIQPSLFEGWSTVVEDCKALNKFMLVSDLDVHKEQIQENCEFFSRDNERELADLLSQYSKEDPMIKDIDYTTFAHSFAVKFMEMATNIKEI